MGKDRLSRELGPREVPEDADESLPEAPPSRGGLLTPNLLLVVPSIEQELSKKNRLLHLKRLQR